MKTMLQLLLVMLTFGGAATGATLVWQKHQAELHKAIQRAEKAESKASENPLADLEKPTPKHVPHDEPPEEQLEPPVAVRPPYVEGVDETNQLVVALNQRLRATHEKETKLNERYEALKLIFSDIRSEQAEINQLREKVGKATQDERDFLRHEHAEIHRLRQDAEKTIRNDHDLPHERQTEADRHPRDIPKSVDDERDLLRQKLDALRSSFPKAEPPALANDAVSTRPAAKITNDPAALKRLAVFLGSMPTEVVAEVLQHLTNQGSDAAVVEILKNMNDQQAAQVLDTIAAADAAKAAALTELLKRP